MSTDYSFYALLCGYMPRPEGVRSENRKVFAFLFLLATGLMAERSAPMCNSLRMYACKHPTSPTITHLPLAGRHQTKKHNLSGLEQREGYLGRDDTNRHKWRLRYALGDG